MFARSDLVLALLGALTMAVAGVGSAHYFGLQPASAAPAASPAYDAN